MKLSLWGGKNIVVVLARYNIRMQRVEMGGNPDSQQVILHALVLYPKVGCPPSLYINGRVGGGLPSGRARGRKGEQAGGRPAKGLM